MRQKWAVRSLECLFESVVQRYVVPYCQYYWTSESLIALLRDRCSIASPFAVNSLANRSLAISLGPTPP